MTILLPFLRVKWSNFNPCNSSTMSSIQAVIGKLEQWAPPRWQEGYDNSGWVCGDPSAECTGVLTALDLTDTVLQEAIDRQINLIVVHHPPLFKPLKRLIEADPITQLLLKAIRSHISIYAIHTNLDNVIWGVNGEIAKRIGLLNVKVLSPLNHTHRKLVTFVPQEHATRLKEALFAAGGGTIGNYSECSFSSTGTGTFKALEGANPYVGQKDKQHQEREEKIELIFPITAQSELVHALHAAHPYETVAYDLLPLENQFSEIGAGAVGDLPSPMPAQDFLLQIKKVFGSTCIRHSHLTPNPIQRVALCGGSGKSLIDNALSNKADAYFTADLGYHDFFKPDGRLLLADIGHYESEQFTSDLLQSFIQQNFPNFAVLKTGANTNPVHYFF